MFAVSCVLEQQKLVARYNFPILNQVPGSDRVDVLEQLRRRAVERPRRIVFPESTDPRVVQAANQFQSAGLGQAVMIQPADPSLIHPDIEQISLSDSVYRERVIDQLIENRKHRGMDLSRAKAAILDPLLFAALLVRIGHVDGSVAGSVATTASVIRAGLYGVGTASGRKLVSSYFLMQLPERAMTYADCGVVPNPSVEELAEIAIASAESHQILTGEVPRVAMLSFSTRGSATHADVEKVKTALEIARSAAPDLLIDGEMQFDAAFDPGVAERKASGSPVAGKANVFVFPDLDAGNIAYKITERVGGAIALGPLIQGLAKPCMDLSRGCTVNDIVDVAVIASVVS